MKGNLYLAAWLHLVLVILTSIVLGTICMAALHLLNTSPPSTEDLEAYQLLSLVRSLAKSSKRIMLIWLPI